MTAPPYIGRFAPSPTGPLHAGSLVAALASWLDARAHGGQWLVRIEDIDAPRCLPGMDQLILAQLAACGLHPDAPPVYQSQRGPLYQAALTTLIDQGLAYPCSCTRSEIAQANLARGWTKPRHGDLVYPGTCRPENGGPKDRSTQAWRLRVPNDTLTPWRWHDRRLGEQHQSLDQTVGDFIIRRADHAWAYQLAVVVDDAAQKITHIVRGEDLADNTPRQQWLQQCLSLPCPSYLHSPLVLGLNGEKLSKQNGAQALDTTQPLMALREAGRALGVNPESDRLESWLNRAVCHWSALPPPHAGG